MTKSSLGKGGLARQVVRGHRRKRVVIAIDSTTAPAQADETIFHGKTPVGTVTSAAWGHRVGKNLVMALINSARADVGTRVSVLLIGERTGTTVVDPCLYDPHHAIPSGLA
ncbi:MAG: glycine cleavage T C-terminal barrel domain-containing protein [Pseudomonadota bacterium]